MRNIVKGSFFESSLETNKYIISNSELEEWFNSNNKPEEFFVSEINFQNLQNWKFVNDYEKLVHSSGKFFSIEGIRVSISDGNITKSWDQPIINQPEIGILCFITRVIDGTRYFLVQAKMEPGNINTLQISPSLQATRSNFTCVHKGKAPAYLDLFMSKNYKVISDQLQTEQGGRFYKKRNRNIVIEIDYEIPLKNEFCWLTLRQIKDLLKRDNIINMDSRSVLSTIPLIDDDVVNIFKRMSKDDFENYITSNHISPLGVELIQSYISTNNINTNEDIISWLTNLKFLTQIDIKKIPLRELENWHIKDNEICHNDYGRYFSVNAVKVRAGSREVAQWTQPLIKDPNVGLLAFVIKNINGIIHFLVQGKVEPGNTDIIEMSPTVSCSNIEEVKKSEKRPFLFDEVVSGKFQILSDSYQSEEGGRFWKLQNRNMIVMAPKDYYIEERQNYIWMTLSQINEFMKHGTFNIEARSLISSLDFM